MMGTRSFEELLELAGEALCANDLVRRFSLAICNRPHKVGIAHALTENGLDIASARIVTDARRVRDSFYIALNGEKVTDTEVQAGIEEALMAAIHARPVAETKGGSI